MRKIIAISFFALGTLQMFTGVAREKTTEEVTQTIMKKTML